MPVFSTDGWVYDQQNPAIVLDQLPGELVDNLGTRSLIDKLYLEGGKALGLSICDRLARGSNHLCVPSWISLPSTTPWHNPTPKFTDWIQVEESRIKVRSSTFWEDWLSGNSGEQHSRTILHTSRVMNHAREISNGRHPVVLQKFIDGIGIVVDIAFSQILKRPIIRISTGREELRTDGIRTFTSATRDHEGRHEVIDPISGTFLLDHCAGELFTGSCLTFPLLRLAQELWEHVNALGISFGVQLELIIHPDTPEVWHLVQIRPSPNHVRCHGAPIQSLKNTLVTTPAVNRAFLCKGTACLTSTDIARWLLYAGSGGIEYAVNQTNTRFNPEQILFWQNDPHPDYGSFMIRAAFQAGAVIQITRRVIAISTTHSGINVHALMPDFDTGISGGGIIAIPDNVHQYIVRKLLARTRTIHAISDGLVGQIALI
ncbi:hypothetical protein HQ487_02325 [Candidatus Uhrbacteria bacterium]|nr:hypothetical protein [Candidatus Uhrbacteria bacterium]